VQAEMEMSGTAGQ